MTYSKKTLLLISIFSFFIIIQSSYSATAQTVGEGRAIFASKGCVGCHSVVRGQVNSKGPALWYAGSKFTSGFIKQWLEEPVKIRPMLYGSITEESAGSHPALLPIDAVAVARYLASFKSDKVRPLGIKAKKTSRGRVIFEKKLGCYGCHEIRKGRRVMGGKSGPKLDDAGSRLNPDWVYAYITEPLYFYPMTAMPLYHKGLSKSDIKVLSAYVGSLKKR